MLLTKSVTRTRWIVLTVLCFGLSAGPVYAASLGNLEVKSKLYEAFDAQIALRGVNEGELEGMRVSLADEAVFERAGLMRSVLLSTLKFEVVATGARRGYVKVSSHERIREPSLSFVVEVTFAGATGTMQRRYDVLLDLK